MSAGSSWEGVGADASAPEYDHHSSSQPGEVLQVLVLDEDVGPRRRRLPGDPPAIPRRHLHGRQRRRSTDRGGQAPARKQAAGRRQPAAPGNRHDGAGSVGRVRGTDLQIGLGGRHGNRTGGTRGAGHQCRPGGKRWTLRSASRVAGIPESPGRSDSAEAGRRRGVHRAAAANVLGDTQHRAGVRSDD